MRVVSWEACRSEKWSFWVLGVFFLGIVVADLLEGMKRQSFVLELPLEWAWACKWLGWVWAGLAGVAEAWQ